MASHPRTPPAGFLAHAIGIGEIGVARGEGVLRTFVGSCVGLAIFDGQQRAAGLAHIMLPESRGDRERPGRYADTAIPELVRLVGELAGRSRPRLAAKLVGGARMFAFQTGLTVGDQNVSAVDRLLEDLGIPVLGRDCGGSHGRRVLFDVATGRMQIEVLGVPPATI